MKEVSLDPKDRTVNQPAVLVGPKQIRQHVTEHLTEFGDELPHGLTFEQIIDVFIKDMISEKYGWLTALKCGQQCLLEATVHIVNWDARRDPSEG